jgi:hypothetical protein
MRMVGLQVVFESLRSIESVEEFLPRPWPFALALIEPVNVLARHALFAAASVVPYAEQWWAVHVARAMRDMQKGQQKIPKGSVTLMSESSFETAQVKLVTIIAPRSLGERIASDLQRVAEAKSELGKKAH